jgi:NitT/TauT family transport system permease protein
VQTQLAGPAAGIIALLVAWELIVRLFNIPRFLLIGPIDAFKAMAVHPEYFAINSWDTVVESAAGFAGGVVLGIAGGLAIFYIPLLRATIYPSLIALNTIPKVALAPLFIV